LRFLNLPDLRFLLHWLHHHQNLLEFQYLQLDFQMILRLVLLLN
jgi:hypothetical protein